MLQPVKRPVAKPYKIDDLGGVAHDINNIIASTAKEVPKGSQVVARGQMQTQHDSFAGLLAGLAFSIVLVYLLIVINFQSWTDPFIIITRRQTTTVQLIKALGGCWKVM